MVDTRMQKKNRNQTETASSTTCWRLVQLISVHTVPSTPYYPYDGAVFTFYPDHGHLSGEISHCCGC